METIEDRLLAILREKFGGAPQLSDSLAFIGVDSLGMAEITVELESEFEIRIGEGIVGIETIQELADFVRQTQAKSSV